MNRCRGFFFPLVLLFVFSCQRDQAYENEPNDQLSQANLISPGESIHGEIESALDRDAIRVEVPQGKLLTFELLHEHAGDLAIDVFFAGRHVKTIDSWASSKRREGRKPIARTNERVSEGAALLDPGGQECILVIHSASPDQTWPQAWELKTSLRDNDGLVELEPNDEIKDAFFLPEGRLVEGFYSPLYHASSPGGLERDLYAWINPETNAMMVEIEVSGVPEVNAVIDLLDSQGQIIRTGDSAGLHQGEKFGPLGVVSQATCFFAIRSDLTSRGNQRIPYKLILKARPAGSNEEFEPNDRLDEANFLNPGIEYQAEIAPENDLDCFRISLTDQGAQTLAVRVQPDQGLRPVLELIDARGRVLSKQTGLTAGEAVYIPNYGLGAGQHRELFLRLGSKDQSGQGGYKISASLYPAGPFSEFEPNNTPKEANPLKPGVDFRGFLYPAGDQDWLVVNLESPGLVKLRFIAPAGVVPLITCQSEGGEVLKEFEPGGGDSSTQIELEAGSWYFGIKAKSGANPRDPWILRFEYSKTN